MVNQTAINEMKTWAAEQKDAMRTQTDALILAQFMTLNREKNIAQQIMENRAACLQILSEARESMVRTSDQAEKEVLINMLPKNCQDTYLRLFTILNCARPESIDRKTIQENIQEIRQPFHTWISEALKNLNDAGRKKSQFVVQAVDTSGYRILTQAEIPEGLIQILRNKNLNLSAAETDVLRFLLSRIGTQVLQEECMIAGGIDNTEAGERRLEGIMDRLQTLLSSLSCTLTVAGNKAYTLMASKNGSTPPWIQALQKPREEYSGPLSSLGRLAKRHPDVSFEVFFESVCTHFAGKQIQKEKLEACMRDENACRPELMAVLKELMKQSAKKIKEDSRSRKRTAKK